MSSAATPGPAPDTSVLDRFVRAQDEGGAYARALAELRAGRKTSHWMWFVLPQLAGLGRSETARFYAISSLDEARAYLAHPVLGPRLRAALEALVGWAGRGRTAGGILGGVDAVKLRSCLTLFAEAAPEDPLFPAGLGAFFNGERDARTLELLGH